MANVTTPTAPATANPAQQATALFAQLQAAQPAGKASKPTTVGCSVTALLRYLGANGCKPKVATAIVALLCKHPVSQNTVTTQLYYARKGIGGKLPTFSTPQLATLNTALQTVLASMQGNG